ncbi:MAG: DUF4935 domain-containing protein [Oscillospiraceae bacterium]|nr:DUF4935 domain-containing protein [Oscillospiraceae bacterium]
MRNAVKEYIGLTDEEEKNLWENATFVFDTNAFINLYRYSKKTRDALLDSMTELKDRVWMPYQVARGFMKKRPEIIYESSERYSGLADEILRPCKERLKMKSDDPEFKALQEYVYNWIERSKNKYHPVESPSKDPVLDAMLDIFDGKVGPSYMPEDFERVKKEGYEHNKKNLLPEYMDRRSALSENDHEDLVVWKQTIDYAAANSKNIIFITHDQKEGWWSILHGKKLGLREELKKEFIESTKMQFHLYTMESFMARYQVIKNIAVDTAVIDEIKSHQELSKR